MNDIQSTGGAKVDNSKINHFEPIETQIIDETMKREINKIAGKTKIIESLAQKHGAIARTIIAEYAKEVKKLEKSLEQFPKRK